MKVANWDERARRRRALIRSVLVTAVLMSATPLLPAAAHSHRYELHPGVTWAPRQAHHPQLTYHVARVQPDAPVRLIPLVAGNQISANPPGRRLAPVSEMCAAVDGVVCINADWDICTGCGVPVGGVVHDGVPWRTPAGTHFQATMLDDGRLVTDHLELDLRLVATFEPDDGGGLINLEEPEPPRREVLVIDSLNRPTGDGIALYSPRWATTTQTREGTVEAVFSGDVPRIGDHAAVKPGRTAGPDSQIPSDGFVLAATGSARDRLTKRVAAMRQADRVELRVGANLPARMSVGGGPVLLRGGQPLPLNAESPTVSNRHPRTLLGWNGRGDLWLVTVDGRQPGRSVGVTLDEATELMASLGATDAINLDGGGSSTFVTGVPCSDGRSPCVRNSPSDGRERFLTTALALEPAFGTTLSAAQTPAPPPPPPTTTTTAPPPTTTTIAAPTTAPTTTAPPTTTTSPPTTVSTTTTTAPTTTARPTTSALPAPPMAAEPTPADDGPSRTGPTTVAAVGVLTTGTLTARLWSRGRGAAAFRLWGWVARLRSLRPGG